MKYNSICTAVFLSRPNRFIAKVILSGQEETVHVKNTGRCKELLVHGAKVILEKSENPNRKTAYDLVAVYKKGLGMVNIDSSAPNAVMKEWLSKQPEISLLKSEYTFGKSRLDFYAEAKGKKILIEVKGCTLEIDGKGYFPDAPTERGVKHLNGLAHAAQNGYECCIAFVIAMPKVTEVFPNNITHPQFGQALKKAQQAGVHTLFLPCNVSTDEISISQCITLL